MKRKKKAAVAVHPHHTSCPVDVYENLRPSYVPIVTHTGANRKTRRECRGRMRWGFNEPYVKPRN